MSSGGGKPEMIYLEELAQREAGPVSEDEIGPIFEATSRNVKLEEDVLRWLSSSEGLISYLYTCFA